MALRCFPEAALSAGSGNQPYEISIANLARIHLFKARDRAFSRLSHGVTELLFAALTGANARTGKGCSAGGNGPPSCFWLTH